MVRVTEFGDVVRFDVATDIAGRGRYWTTCYLVGSTLIDTGCAHAAPEFVRVLAGRPIDRILLTHCHEDHIGGTGAVRRDRGDIPVHAHPGCAEVLADPRRKQPLHPYRRVMWGWPLPAPAHPVVEGDVIDAPPFRFQALYMPGHSVDHLCFLEPDRRWLFSGDLYVGGKDRALRNDGHVWDIIASLRRAAGLSLATLFPGSARVPDDPHGALAGKIAYYEDLGGRVVDLRRKGRSIGAITRLVCGGPMPIEFVTLGHYSRRNLVRSFLEDPTRFPTPALP
jgi:glyoxylase-like metal-dependent hydrolase (beta-lactamase superfamily II)